MIDRNRALIKGTLILTIGNICSKVVAFGSAFFFTRWISVADFGAFDLILTYNALFIPLFSLAIYEATYRYVIGHTNERVRAKIITNSFVVTIIGSILMMLFIVF